MGVCVSQKNDQQFSIDDLNGMEKYYSILPKRKADILRWMTTSEGPWKVSDSFSCFQITDAKINPMKMSNEDEVRSHALQSKSIIHSDCKKTSNSYGDRKHQSMSYNLIDSSFSTRSSIDVNRDCSLNWPSDW